MRAIQMTLDEDLIREVDRLAKRLGTTRSAFTREALRSALTRHTLKRLEEQHRLGYERHPVREGEFDSFEDEQVWGEP